MEHKLECAQCLEVYNDRAAVCGVDCESHMLCNSLLPRVSPLRLSACAFQGGSDHSSAARSASRTAGASGWGCCGHACTCLPVRLYFSPLAIHLRDCRAGHRGRHVATTYGPSRTDSRVHNFPGAYFISAEIVRNLLFCNGAGQPASLFSPTAVCLTRHHCPARPH